MISPLICTTPFKKLLLATAGLLVSLNLCAQVCIDCLQGPVTCNGSVTGELDDGDCTLSDGTFIDVYVLTLAAPATVTITLNSGAIDSYLFLFDSSCNPIDQNDDCDEVCCGSCIEMSLPAGTYYVGANSYEPESGPYTVTVTCVGPSEIRGYTWEDRNASGAWEAGERGIDGTIIFLDLNNNGTLDGSEPASVTGDDPNTAAVEVGAYSFTGLSPGTYTVRETLPGGMTRSYPFGAHDVTVAMSQLLQGDFGQAEPPNFGIVPPSLSIARQGANVRVFWPVSASGFLLEQSPAVTGLWSQVTSSYVTNATDISITVPAPTDTKFYRLSRP